MGVIIGAGTWVAGIAVARIMPGRILVMGRGLGMQSVRSGVTAIGHRRIAGRRVAVAVVTGVAAGRHPSAVVAVMLVADGTILAFLMGVGRFGDIDGIVGSGVMTCGANVVDVGCTATVKLIETVAEGDAVEAGHNHVPGKDAVVIRTAEVIGILRVLHALQIVDHGDVAGAVRIVAGQAELGKVRTLLTGVGRVGVVVGLDVNARFGVSRTAGGVAVLAGEAGDQTVVVAEAVDMATGGGIGHGVVAVLAGLVRLGVASRRIGSRRVVVVAAAQCRRLVRCSNSIRAGICVRGGVGPGMASGAVDGGIVTPDRYRVASLDAVARVTDLGISLGAGGIGNGDVAIEMARMGAVSESSCSVAVVAGDIGLGGIDMNGMRSGCNRRRIAGATRMAAVTGEVPGGLVAVIPVDSRVAGSVEIVTVEVAGAGHRIIGGSGKSVIKSAAAGDKVDILHAVDVHAAGLLVGRTQQPRCYCQQRY